MSPSFWVFPYLAQLLLVSSALGAATLHMPRIVAVPRVSRFLIGFCLTPFVLGLWMLLTAAVLPGAPRWLLLIIPSGASVLVLATRGTRTARRLWSDFRWMRRPALNRPAYLLTGAAILLTLFVATKLILNGRQPITGNDALFYLGQALRFADARTLSAVNDFSGASDGSMMGDTHSFLFPAFLSHALITTVDNPLGYPYDWAARTAFQVTIPYLFLAIMALAATSRIPATGSLAVILLLQVPQYEYISHESSRDAFRTIPLLLLATVLVGLRPWRLRKSLRLTELIPVLVLAALAMAGHILGIIVIAAVSGAWLCWSLGGRVPLAKIALVVAAIGVGSLLGGNQYVRAYAQTGSIVGDNTFYDSAVSGTPLRPALVDIDTGRLQGTTGPWDRALTILSRDGYRMSVPGLIGAVIALVLARRVRRSRSARVIPFAGLLLVANTLVLFVNFRQITPLEWFVTNLRYQLHWYPFAAVCVAMLMTYCFAGVTRSRGTSMRAAGTIALVLITSLITLSAYTVVRDMWRLNDWGDEWVSENVGVLGLTADRLPPGQRLLLAGRYNYYVHGKAMVMYSRPSWPVTWARNDTEVKSALGGAGIGAVALMENQIEDYWDRSPLFKFLDNPANGVAKTQNEHLRVYVLK